MTPRPELFRPLPVRRLPPARTEPDATTELVEATPAECAALARRLDVPAVEAVHCRFRLSGADAAGVVTADGLLCARLTRVCVTTLEEFPAAVAEPFTLRFVPEGRGAADDDPLDLEGDDEVPYADGVIDLGEAAVQQLALALDPYPRRPGAERPAFVGLGDPPGAGSEAEPGEADAEAAERDPDEPGPFAVLRGLRRPDG